ncbi:hypothetical protein PG994_001873 [Apiospora phragmitis]|uniref:Genetic interactor of prohibitins 3, mitochondrial n=1 Tax=Apiospora phragmitis TaxID=2905665 RepID=A0ABR1WUT2_9PEZI
MHRAISTKWLGSSLRTAERSSSLQLPIFLCPAFGNRHNHNLSRPRTTLRTPPPSWKAQRRCVQTQAEPTDSALIEPSGVPEPDPVPIRDLPTQCTGCGALSQTFASDQPGYYDLGRKAVRWYLGLEKSRSKRAIRDREEEGVYQDVLRKFDEAEIEKLGLDVEDIAPTLAAQPEPEPQERPLKVPLCDRCHNLMHHQTGNSIFHPTMDSIRDTLAESPYKYNHVYHVLDAADFPMSLLPQIHQLLDLMPLRTKNRRAKAGKFFHNQKTEMSFIITRADLLGPIKFRVDRLMPYLREVLRDALGRAGRELRLGNVHCVSARRSWWTKELKEDIWKRGGAGWMVGKVNVGKSQLFEAVFPKGRMDWNPSRHQIAIDMYGKEVTNTGSTSARAGGSEESGDDLGVKMDEQDLDELALLPPAAPESQYPAMPLVSDLPGTTASPIRVPFGNGRGELIDLPGVERTGLEKYVKPDHRSSLLMRSRIVPEQMVVKQGKSILLGGLIRITPRVPGPIVLSYAFTPIQPHLTATEKADELQRQVSELNIDTITATGTGETIKLAGSYPLKWDVTKERSGPLTRRDAVGLKVNHLPYRVLATDILIEGVGWVEVVAQVRKKDLFTRPAVAEEDLSRMESESSSPWAQTGAKAEAAAEAEPKTTTALSALERLEAIGEDPSRRQKTYVPPRVAAVPIKPGDEPNWPIVDVYSPEGRFIGCRKPMNGWLLNKPLVTAAQQRKRPRKSMKGQKKLEKKIRREQTG